MSHEGIQAFTLIKKVRRSHEMIQVIYRCLLTMVNKKIDKNKYSQTSSQ